MFQNNAPKFFCSRICTFRQAEIWDYSGEPSQLDGANMPRFSQTIRPEDRLALRVNEASIVAGISRSTIYKLMASKKLRTTKVGGRRLVLREDLQKLLLAGVV
jgi:excisionase family DNA binding protein